MLEKELVRKIESTLFLVGIILVLYLFKRYFKDDFLIELYIERGRRARFDNVNIEIRFLVVPNLYPGILALVGVYAQRVRR